MVDRTILTHELEAAAHRCAAMSTSCERFYIGAERGAVRYISVTKGGKEHFYTLINGEWTEAEPLHTDGGDEQ